MDKSLNSRLGFLQYVANDLESLMTELLNDYAAYGKSPDTYFQECFESKLRMELQIRVDVLRRLSSEVDVAPRERSVN